MSEKAAGKNTDKHTKADAEDVSRRDFLRKTTVGAGAAAAALGAALVVIYLLGRAFFRHDPKLADKSGAITGSLQQRWIALGKLRARHRRAIGDDG
ncbi:MAG: twin-arginine translocation signal domain-containing protein, partial [Candidatus Hydrogenedentes bacterium]|nr:twin-arginine translocation signal domain-containing protein [Candidatus Hydrogenedentota bacterium]